MEVFFLLSIFAKVLFLSFKNQYMFNFFKRKKKELPPKPQRDFYSGSSGSYYGSLYQDMGGLYTGSAIDFGESSPPPATHVHDSGSFSGLGGGDFGGAGAGGSWGGDNSSSHSSHDSGSSYDSGSSSYDSGSSSCDSGSSDSGSSSSSD